MTAAPHRPQRDPLVSPGGADLHARDMTATFAADVTLADAQARLAAVGQWLPVDGDPADTLGRLVDANSTGPLRLGYGAWRDLLLGAQLRGGRGELVSAGGRTVKNVAGYDLTKLVVGQHGAFGSLVTLTARTYRRPAGAVLATFRPPDPGRLALLLPSPLRPQWAVLTADALYCGYLADDRTLAFYRDRLPTIDPAEVASRSADDDVAHRQSLWCVAGPRTFRASVPPAEVSAFISRARLDRWSADVAFGIVVGNAPADRTALMNAAVEVGGTIAVWDRNADGPPAVYPPMDRCEAKVVERLKQAFGRDGALNPPSPVPSPGTPGED